MRNKVMIEIDDCDLCSNPSTSVCAYDRKERKLPKEKRDKQGTFTPVPKWCPCGNESVIKYINELEKKIEKAMLRLMGIK